MEPNYSKPNKTSKALSDVRLAYGIVASILTVIALLLFADTPSIVSGDTFLVSQFVKARGPRHAPDDIVTLTIERDNTMPSGYMQDENVMSMLGKLAESSPQWVILDSTFYVNVVGSSRDPNYNFLHQLNYSAVVPHLMLDLHAPWQDTAKIPFQNLLVAHSYAGEDYLYNESFLRSNYLGRKIPIERDPTPDDYLNFYGPHGTFRSISLKDLSNPAIVSSLKGKIIVVGRSFTDDESVQVYDSPFGLCMNMKF